jgi:hypothetical protein
VWCADTSKFTAKYGDHPSANSDLEEIDPTVSSRSSPGPTRTPGTGPLIPSSPAYLDGKSSREAELESRLRNLLSDMEGIVDQVLGLDSACALFLRKRFLPAVSVERTGGQWSLTVSALFCLLFCAITFAGISIESVFLHAFFLCVCVCL